ncbi:MAG: pyridoxamine 5'-phosphate oxidase family protein [Solirubrobacterales bacterium]
MASKRDQIKLDDAEIAAYLAEEKTVVVATTGPNGRPHLMPLWFVVRGTEIWGWTFAKSQKAKNLTRDQHATLLFEDGVSYEKLRGVMYECDVEILRDSDAIRDIGIELFTKYGDGNYPAEPVIAMIEAQVPKRIGLRFTPTRTVSWDHGKLASGVY